MSGDILVVTTKVGATCLPGGRGKDSDVPEYPIVHRIDPHSGELSSPKLTIPNPEGFWNKRRWGL